MIVQRTLLALFILTLASCATIDSNTSHRIEEASYRTIGGIEQWVTIRGDDRRKPILLLVHGGPGDAQSPFKQTYAPYEKDFVLVQWDQRGAGRTFAKVGGERSNLTLERSVDDGIELSIALRAQFPNQKLILFGHSWGSVVATGMAIERPDLFELYVGTGQVSSWASSVHFQYDYLKAQLRQAGDTNGVAALDAIGKPDPTNITQYFTFTRPLRQYMHPADKAWLAELKARALANGETDADIKFSADGQGYSGRTLIQEIVKEDLLATAPRVELPYCVIQGRHDVSTPTDAAKAYFDKLQAPRKQFFVIEDAGHFALSTHPVEMIGKLKSCIARS